MAREGGGNVPDTSDGSRLQTKSAADAGFWRGVFCEVDGVPSLSRVATAVVVAFAVGWATALVRLNHALPDFAGLSCFIGTLYGVNKISNAFGRDKAL
jgi:hypothetical protein